MKKSNPGILFMTGFLRTSVIILILLTVGFLSYNITLAYYRFTEKPISSRFDQYIKDWFQGVELTDISENLILSVNDDTGKVEKVVIEMFNRTTANLDYITIPPDTTFTISNEKYQQICGISSEIPQIVKLSDLSLYFEKDQLGECGMILVKDLLDTDLTYYSILPSSVYGQIFKSEDRYFSFKKQDGTKNGGTYSVEIFTSAFADKLKAWKDEKAIRSYMKQMDQKIHSNLSLRRKLKHVQYYKNIHPEYIYFYSIFGENGDDGFRPDSYATNQLMISLLGNEYYSKKQELGMEEAVSDDLSSKKLNVHIENSTGISGLAADLQSRLMKDGFMVSEVGNYEGTMQEVTKILVKKEGVGQDLLLYFRNPVLETGVLPDGVDIKIIIGAADGSKN